MKSNTSKQRVIDAALSLFYQKGFHGTSVRDIATKASVNLSLISYYFKGKQGLLEYAVTRYYEDYLETIEETIQEYETEKPVEKLKKLITSIIQYKHKNYQISCFIHRELSIDSVFVREVSVTYLAKENHLLKSILTETMEQHESLKLNHHFLFMQLKGMLITPYLLQHEWKSYTSNDYSHQKFIKNYVKVIHKWIDFIFEQAKEKTTT
ncbi:forespore capture DNA-binding protein RefZ [Ornithinibacillus halophilus]|uniref:Transcriptional regulator, TetR family n=1 Tax=Ornithinibacillus halophilus TaxID=930117 RepID=A0A1M5EJW5_9BACI|nr:forespore capture DNA-binding protein RefZ [Ornithinibacillus halophilus]SHF79466.1 transcriptional regulator, TetR family [Ornithinibacillus halophilus]